MKRILHISNYFSPHIGGIEQTAKDIVDALEGKYEQRVICFNHKRGNVVDWYKNTPITRVGCQLKISSQSIALSYGKMLKKIMSSFKPDIILFHYPNPFVAHYLCKYLKNRSFKFILYWHLDITKQKFLRNFFVHQNNKLLNSADKIVATSPNYIDGSLWLSKSKDKCVVIPSCINEERLKINQKHIDESTKLRERFKDKTICFAFGRHVEYKGLKYLIEASKYLDDSFIIFIGGCGPLTKKLKKEAKNDCKVVFLGKLSDDELKVYLQLCDVFCFPSITKNEAFGLGLAEAMSFSKPVVTFKIPGSGVNYVSIDAVTGIEVENKNVADYAKAITLLSNKKNASFFGNNAKNRVLELFSQNKFYNNVIELIKQF